MPHSLWSRPTPFIVIHCLVWWIMTICAKNALDGYGDMAEVYAWSQHWLAGSDKHPQFLPWIARLWFSVAPQTVVSFYLLSAINLAVALFGIGALGRALKFSDLQITLALALSAVALPYLTLPGKLNMNTICLSVWPWVAWAFVRTIEPGAAHRLARAALFGVLAAIAMLGKYYSIVLLIPLFAYTLVPSQRWIWRTAAPWIAMAAFLLAVAPHIAWLARHAEAVAYASEQGVSDDSGRKFLYILKFIVAPLLYWPLPLIICAVALVRGPLPDRLAQLFRWRAMPGVLAVAAIGPWLTTILFSLFGFAELSLPWIIPLGFAFTLYLVANADPQMLASNGPRLLRTFKVIWPLMIAAGIATGVVAGLKGHTRFYAPNEQAAAAAMNRWNESHSQPLRWVAKGNDAALLAFLAPGSIEALPNLPDRLPAYYPAREAWKSEAGLIFCSLEPAGTADRDCIAAATAWAEAAGLRSEAVTLSVRREGLRYPRDIPFDLAVVYVWP